VIALLRYQTAIMLRSHRWIFPVIAYGALIAVGAAGSTPLAEELGWTAAMLVPVVAFLTRSMLTAEPDAARACAAAAAGPIRAQLATLLAAFGGGIVLAVGGACFAVLTSESVAKGQQAIVAKAAAAFAHPQVLAAGLVTAVICLLVGAAVGALCNPPLLRHPAAAMLATLAAAIFALASDVSPAGAALRLSSAAQSQPQAAQWPGVVPLVASACLVAVTWGASVFAAAKRG